MSGSWRDIARPIIAEVINSNPEDLKKALREAYPFGERKYHPYKIWLDEVKVQTRRKYFGQKKGIKVGKNQLKLL